MKKLSLLFIAFLLLQFTALAQSGWVQQTSGTNWRLSAVSFTDVNSGTAVGDSNYILRTTNGGTNWNYQSPGLGWPVWSNFLSVDFVDNNTGWITGWWWSGIPIKIVGKTTDGGTNWELLQNGGGWQLNSVDFVNIETGWGVGHHGTILKTTDGGTNWDSQTSGITTILQSVYFFDINTGWAVGDGGFVLNTTDGGDNWIVQNSGVNNHLFCIQFINENLGWVGGIGTILTTTDGGANWTANQTPGLTNTSICFVDESNGWIVSNANIGNAGMIQHSTDGGGTWTAQLTDVEPLLSIQFVDEYTGWAVGDSGAIYYTTNGGISFVEENEIVEMPTDFSLRQNFPNPFYNSSVIRYSIPQSFQVVIKVFDILGNEIETLVNKEKPALMRLLGMQMDYRVEFIYIN